MKKPTIKNVYEHNICMAQPNDKAPDRLLLGFNKDFYPDPEHLKAYRLDHTKLWGVSVPCNSNSFHVTSACVLIYNWCLLHYNPTLKNYYMDGKLLDTVTIEDMIEQGLLLPYDLKKHGAYSGAVTII